MSALTIWHESRAEARWNRRIGARWSPLKPGPPASSVKLLGKLDGTYRARLRSCLNLATFHFPRILINSPASLNFLFSSVSAFVSSPTIHRRAFCDWKSPRYFSRAHKLILTVSPLLLLRIDKTDGMLHHPLY